MKRLQAKVDFTVDHFTPIGHIDILKKELSKILSDEIVNIIPIEETTLNESGGIVTKQAGIEFFIMDKNESKKLFEFINKWYYIGDNIELKSMLKELKEIIK